MQYLENAKNKTEIIFSEIESKILDTTFDAGLIIHENRFTFEKKGLKKIIDLGEYWESITNSPIPLGGIAVKRNLPDEIKQRINRVLKRSVEFAFINPTSSADFVKANAQELDEKVTQQHINLYVNDYTIDLGAIGINAISNLYKKAVEINYFETNNLNLFIN